MINLTKAGDLNCGTTSSIGVSSQIIEFVERFTDCRVCYKVVKKRQEALECDSCRQWVHRLCGTGITQAQYRSISKRLRDGGKFDWLCPACSQKTKALPHAADVSNGAAVEFERPAFESTRVEQPPVYEVNPQRYVSINQQHYITIILLHFQSKFPLCS